jgi:hypothetical protein
MATDMKWHANGTQCVAPWDCAEDDVTGQTRQFMVQFVTGQSIVVWAGDADQAHTVAQNEMPTTAAGTVTPMQVGTWAN